MSIQQLKWQTYPELINQLSKVEKEWLFDKGSLTKKIKLLSHNHFFLEILQEQKQFLRKDEYKYLMISSLRQEWVRTVVLNGYDSPLIYARSVIIPMGDTTRSLVDVGEAPLGSVLFTAGLFERSELQVAQYPTNLLPTCYSENWLWARRSKFQNDTQIVLVQEVFLPQLWYAVQCVK